MELMRYKDYEGTAEVDMEHQTCFGKILFINDLVTYEGDDPKQLFRAFCEAVDDYLETCKEIGKEPEKAIKGAFNVRVPAELHKCAIRKSIEIDTSLNDVVIKALELFLYGNAKINHVTNYFVQSGKTQFKTLDVTASSANLNWVATSSTKEGVKYGN